MSPVLPAKLIKNLYKKRDLINAGKKHDHIRPVLLILGGGMGGASGAGVVTALQKLGLGKVFDVVIGISTGATISAYFLAGPKQTEIGTTIYYQDLPTKFVKYFRNPIADIDFAESVVRKGPKKLDVQAVMNNRSEFFVFDTQVPTAKSVLINTKTAPDMITAMKGSMAIPGLYGKVVEVNKHLYVDGDFSNPFPVVQVIKKFHPTDLLIIDNRTEEVNKNNNRPFIEWLIVPITLIKSSPMIRRSASERPKHYHEALKYLMNQKEVNWGILWSPDNGTQPLTVDCKKLRELTHLSARRTLQIFGQPKLRINLPPVK